MISGSDFQETTQDVFEQLVKAHAVRSITVLFVDNVAAISFVLQSDAWGYVFTRRGALKRFRVETALALVRSLGFKRATVAFEQPEGFALDQAQDDV